MSTNENIVVNNEDIADKMLEMGFNPEENPEDGWSDAFMDSMQDMYDIETSVRKVFEKRFPHIKFV